MEGNGHVHETVTFKNGSLFNFFFNDYNLSVSQKNKYRCFEKYIRIEFEFEERADVEFFSPRNVTINAFLSQLREIENQQRYSDDCPLYKM